MKLTKNGFVFLLAFVFLQGVYLQAAKGFDPITNIDDSLNDSINKSTFFSIANGVQIVGLENITVDPKIQQSAISKTVENSLHATSFQPTEQLDLALFYVAESANIYIAPNTILVIGLQELLPVITNEQSNKTKHSAAKHYITKASSNSLKINNCPKNLPRFPLSPKQDSCLSAAAASGFVVSLHPKVKALARLNAQDCYFIQNKATKPQLADAQNKYWFLRQQLHQNKAPPRAVLV